jgi:hypothetical protein
MKSPNRGKYTAQFHFVPFLWRNSHNASPPEGWKRTEGASTVLELAYRKAGLCYFTTHIDLRENINRPVLSRRLKANGTSEANAVNRVNDIA